MTTRKTKKSKVRHNPDGSRTYGPYKGSKQNDGRPVVVHSKGKGHPGSTSSNAARDEKERAVGHKLHKKQHVAHKGRTNKQGNKSTSASSTRVESAKKNISDENKRRGRAK